MTHSQRGDTLVEVIVSFAVFAMIAVGALTVMNQGTASAQDTLETTLVRQQIDNQAEMLRFLHQSYLANPGDTTAGSLSEKFRSIVTVATTANLNQPSEYGSSCTQALPEPALNRFALNVDTGALITNTIAANSAPQEPVAKVTNSAAYGMWIEPVLSNSGESSRFIDFHIRACWNAVASGPQRTLGTIVRLYVPENIATGTTGAETTPIAGPSPNNFTMYGRDATDCHPHANTSTNDPNPPDPGWNPADSSYWYVSPPPMWQCQYSGNEVYSCISYDAWFRPSNQGFTSASRGKYNMTISYNDSQLCGPGIISPFTFKVAIYKNNAKYRDVNLSAAATSATVDVGDVDENTVLQLRWYNNYHFNQNGDPVDPDFVISRLYLDRYE